MSDSLAFAQQFAQLTWLISNGSPDVAEQKETLRAMVAALGRSPMVISQGELSLHITTSPPSERMLRLNDLSLRMAAHSVREMAISSEASATDLLALAKAIASAPTPGDEGTAFDAKLVALGTSAIRVTLGVGGFVRTGNTPPVVPKLVAAPARTPAPMRAMPAIDARTPARSVTPSNVPATGRGAGGSPTPRQNPVLDSRAIDPRMLPRDFEERGRRQGPAIPDESSGIIERIIAPGEGGTELDLFEQLEAVPPPPNATRLVEDLVRLAEAYALEQRWDAVCRIFVALTRGEESAEQPELRRAYILGLRRLRKPTLLRAVAKFVPRHPEQREELQYILLRAGAEAAEVLIDLLAEAESSSDRRAYLSTLGKCRAAVPTLIHTLGDSRWYVVRNAVDLLGELQAAEADALIADQLHHADERVRRSAATALCRIATQRALQGALQALADPAPQVRIHAATGLASTRSSRAAIALSNALDAEHVEEVQLALLSGLGRIATSQSVEKLVKAAAPDGRLFRKKTVAYRTAAVLGLGEAGTPAALAALKTLVEDREREVRDAAHRAIDRATRASVTEM